MHATNPQNDWKELATRQNDGLRISLLWHHDGRVKVTVGDARLGREFEFGVPGADALEAFNHPFAHAPSESCRSIGIQRMTASLQQQS
jgi:hypothetical protein